MRLYCVLFHDQKDNTIKMSFKGDMLVPMYAPGNITFFATAKYIFVAPGNRFFHKVRTIMWNYVLVMPWACSQ